MASADVTPLTPRHVNRIRILQSDGTAEANSQQTSPVPPGVQTTAAKRPLLRFFRCHLLSTARYYVHGAVVACRAADAQVVRPVSFVRSRAPQHSDLAQSR